jgi:hypothetical protein
MRQWFGGFGSLWYGRRMEQILFKNRKLEISANGPGNLILVVSNKHMANKLNNALGGYYPVTIKEDEEPIFKISREQLNKTLDLCFGATMATYIRGILEKQ